MRYAAPQRRGPRLQRPSRAALHLTQREGRRIAAIEIADEGHAVVVQVEMNGFLSRGGSQNAS